MKKIFTAVTAGVFALSAAACNTIEGAAEDVESVAEEVDEEL